MYNQANTRDKRSFDQSDALRSSLLASVDVDDVGQFTHDEKHGPYNGTADQEGVSIYTEDGGLSVTVDSSMSVSMQLLPPTVDDTPKEPQRTRAALGMAWFAGSAFFFAAMGICSKQLGMLGYNVWEINLVRGFMIAICVAPRLILEGKSPWGNRRWLLVARGLVGVTSITCYFAACQLLPLEDATVFTFLAPLVAAVLSPLILGESVSIATLIVIPVNVAGVLLVVQPKLLFGSSILQLSTIGVAIGLSQPFFSALSKITIRLLRTTEDTHVIIFYYTITMIVYALIGCAATWHAMILPHSWLEVGLLLGQGLSGFGNQTCITNGLRNGKAAPVMSMQYLTIIFSQAASVLIFHEHSNTLGHIGLITIVGSMLLYIWFEATRK